MIRRFARWLLGEPQQVIVNAPAYDPQKLAAIVRAEFVKQKRNGTNLFP